MPNSQRRVFDGSRPHPSAWDELFERGCEPHAHCSPLVERLGRLLTTEFQLRRASADLAFVNQGITFSVYSDRRGSRGGPRRPVGWPRARHRIRARIMHPD
ncbi:MAG TPA: hypothetical protein VKE74_01000 [Gemmataceae bacterium]|nr:hypothetical protein [Gemmataceae bacterium]